MRPKHKVKLKSQNALQYRQHTNKGSCTCGRRCWSGGSYNHCHTHTHTHTHTQKISSRRRTVAGFIRVQCGRGARPALKPAQILRQPTHRNSFTSVASIVLCFANFSNNHAYNNGWEVHSFMSNFTFISVSYVQVLLMLCSTLQPSR